MSIQASCGHILSENDGPDGMGHSIAIKSESRECRPAVAYPTVCTPCLARYRAQDLILTSDADEFAWMSETTAPPTKAPCMTSNTTPQYMCLPQQEFLRIAMDSLTLQRSELAARIDVSPRTLDKWLLPEDSKDCRKMPAIARKFLSEILAKTK